MFKFHSSGPWNIKTDHKEAIEQIAHDINLIPLIKVMALDNLGSYFYPGTITFALPRAGTSGHADFLGHIVIGNSEKYSFF